MEVKSPAPDPAPASRSTAGRLTLAQRSPQTFPELLEHWVRGHGDEVFLPRRSARRHEPVTFAQLAADVDRLSAALLSLGIGRGDRVGLLAENRYEWLLCDLGTTGIGAIDVPRGSDTSPAEMLFILQHSGCRLAFVEDEATARTLLAHRRELPELEHVVVMADTTAVDGARALGELLRLGERWLGGDRARLAAATAAVRSDDLLTIVYTSGTTAEPKGVMLTHGNVLANVRDTCAVLHITGSDSFLSVLPAWHMYERIMDYLALAAGGQLIYTDRRHFKDDLQQVAPTVFAAVPRIWEAIHDGIAGHAHKLAGMQGRLLRRTLQLARLVGGRRAGAWARLQHWLLGQLVLPKLRAFTGGRLRLAVSGGGSLPRHVDETLLGLGLPLLNGYGLTETSPVASVRLPERNGPGTIGPPLPNTSIEARDAEGRRLPPGQTGVLWIKGPQVMRGYYRNPQRTEAVLDGDGWFHTGDLGHVDGDGQVWITGRAKDTIVLASGENVEPEPIEAAIKTSPLIEQAIVVGQDQKHLGALLVPARDCLAHAVPMAEWDVADGRLRCKAVHELYRRELDQLVCRATGFRSIDHIATFCVLHEPLTPENGLLTHTLKVKRHVVQERFAAQIAGLFS